MSTSRPKPVKGQEVHVFDVRDRRMPPGGWPGHVEAVGSKYFTVAYDGGMSLARFLNDTWRTGDHWEDRWVVTIAEAESTLRWDAAERELRTHGILIDQRNRFDADQLDALVQLVRQLPQKDNEEIGFLE